jgi:hypothetical protein
LKFKGYALSALKKLSPAEKALKNPVQLLFRKWVSCLAAPRRAEHALKRNFAQQHRKQCQS